MDKMTPATLKRNSGERVRKSIPVTMNMADEGETVISIHDIKTTKGKFRDIIKLADNILNSNENYVVNIDVRKQGEDNAVG